MRGARSSNKAGDVEMRKDAGWSLMGRHFVAAIACFVVVGAGACGGDSEGGTDAAGGGTAGPPSTEVVTAADGGTVETEGGKAKVEIPAGALAEDTEISIEPAGTSGQPEADHLVSNVFELGPDGTTFSSPVTITLAVTGEVPSGSTPVLATLKDGAWEAVFGSTYADKAVHGEVTHFSSFAAWVESTGETTPPTGGGGGRFFWVDKDNDLHSMLPDGTDLADHPPRWLGGPWGEP